jgi:formamidopyrimidine-DNA glycosylase
MPELPEVEEAAGRLRRALVGRTLTGVRPLHRVLAARLPPRQRRALRGATVVGVDRRGKHQLIRLDDGRIIHVHFRMSGDWQVLGAEAPPRSARLLLELDDATRVALVDPRALATVDVHPAGAPPVMELGPEATDPDIDVDAILARLARRRGAIKPALLDQRILAGVGNIYAAEALWHAKIDPRRPASELSRPEVARLLRGVRTVLERATGSRYADERDRFAVYGREGAPCRRCRTTIARVMQAGRSTYFCPGCQGIEAKPAARPARARVSRAPRGARP